MADVAPDQLGGFFVGWRQPPSPDQHLRMLRGSKHAVLARLAGSGQIVGFATAISDGVHSAYIPLLEVLPAYQRQGIGSELIGRLLEMLSGYPMVDVICDDDLISFYEHLGFSRGNAMIIRR